MEKQNILYSGKSKTIYMTDDPDRYIMSFRDDATALNGAKKAQVVNKGKINNQFNAFIMKLLKKHAIPNHFEKLLTPTDSLVKSVTIIPVECIIRNRVTGSLQKRLELEEGTPIPSPIFEFYLKNDALGDPFINDDHVKFLKLATITEILYLKKLSHQINDILLKLFSTVGLILVDFKLEFGRFGNKIHLADEITPDNCRIWDAQTGMKYDKDRFRLDLGDLTEGYLEICRRLNIEIYDLADA